MRLGEFVNCGGKSLNFSHAAVARRVMRACRVITEKCGEMVPELELDLDVGAN